MNGDTPCVKARWVRVTPASAPPAAPGRAAPGALLPATSSTFEPGGAAGVFSGGAYLGAQATFNFAAGGVAAYSGAAGASVTVTTPGTATWHVQVKSSAAGVHWGRPFPLRLHLCVAACGAHAAALCYAPQTQPPSKSYIAPY